ncbi:hypothetical protein E2C01_063965 [Portunus trituberculatus]|uniref:Uncharacterized protein n=1 Tax=Portunus trituberculatus TaxID=210409 RepID=A0A5B7HMH8_PORTR|nr:hypothetical protein [Portunus trituberculatus]
MTLLSSGCTLASPCCPAYLTAYLRHHHTAISHTEGDEVLSIRNTISTGPCQAEGGTGGTGRHTNTGRRTNPCQVFLQINHRQHYAIATALTTHRLAASHYTERQ